MTPTFKLTLQLI